MDMSTLPLVLALVFLSLSSVLCDFNQPNDREMPPAQEGRPVFDANQARFDRNHIQNQDHIMEHYEGVLNKPESEMSEEELQFHYFKLHDYDHNNKLDGLEIINAMTHQHKEEKHDDHQEKRMTDEELIEVIDGIMTDEDLNKDGYIDYSEFVSAQRTQNEDVEVGDQQLNMQDSQQKEQQPVIDLQ